MTPSQTSEPVDRAAIEAMSGISSLFSDAAERGRAAIEAGLSAWTEEAQRYYEELSSQGRDAISQLKACQSPMEVLQVEQAWIAARAKAFMDSGLRFAQAFSTIAQGHEAKNAGRAPPPAQAPSAKAPTTAA